MDQAKNMKNWVVKTKNLTAKDIEKIQQDLQTKAQLIEAPTRLTRSRSRALGININADLNIYTPTRKPKSQTAKDGRNRSNGTGCSAAIETDKSQPKVTTAKDGRNQSNGAGCSAAIETDKSQPKVTKRKSNDDGNQPAKKRKCSRQNDTVEVPKSIMDSQINEYSDFLNGINESDESDERNKAKKKKSSNDNGENYMFIQPYARPAKKPSTKVNDSLNVTPDPLPEPQVVEPSKSYARPDKKPTNKVNDSINVTPYPLPEPRAVEPSKPYASPAKKPSNKVNNSLNVTPDPLPDARVVEPPKTIAVMTFSVGEVVWSKIKGHPGWPCKIKSFHGRFAIVWWFNDYRTTKIYRTQLFKFLINFDKFAVNFDRSIGLKTAAREALMYYGTMFQKLNCDI